MKYFLKHALETWCCGQHKDLKISFFLIFFFKNKLIKNSILSEMFYSFLFISILVFTTNAAISDIATVGGITGYPAIVYTKGQANTAK